MSRPIVLGITGASGAVYATRLLETLLHAGQEVHLSISPAGAAVIQQELSYKVDMPSVNIAELINAGRKGLQLDVTDIAVRSGQVVVHAYGNLLASIASGSFLTNGMVICPCSGGTLAAVAQSSSGNLIQRAAEVHLKERRKLILVPRETPLSLPQIENMRAATLAGAVILPAAPGWYHGVHGLRDLADFVVARICDQLGVENKLMRRWGE